MIAFWQSGFVRTGLAKPDPTCEVFPVSRNWKYPDRVLMVTSSELRRVVELREHPNWQEVVGTTEGTGGKAWP